MEDAPEFATPRQRAQIGALVAEFLDGLPFETAEQLIKNPSALALRETINTVLAAARNRSMALQGHSGSFRLVTIEPENLLRFDRRDSPGYLDFSVEAYKTRFLRVDRWRSLAGIPIKTQPRKLVETIDLTKVTRVLMLEPGETSISSGENLRRIKASGGKTLLDIRVMEEFLRRPWFIPEEFSNRLHYSFLGHYFTRCARGTLCCGYPLERRRYMGREFHWLPHALHDCHFAACLED